MIRYGGFLLAWIFIFLTGPETARGQKVYVNTPDQVYELTGGPGSCNYTPLGDFCFRNDGTTLYSSALFRDTFYFITSRNNNLYRVIPGTSWGCEFLTDFILTSPNPAISALNALTVDKNGILYIASALNGELFQYDPHTRTKTLLGRLPVPSGGDLIFVDDKLLLATIMGNIYEVNINDPAASTLYMNTAPYLFYGLISMPFNCNKNKIYGFAPDGPNTNLVEIDIENKLILGIQCSFPFQIYDGASSVENGSTAGVSIDSLVMYGACDPQQQTGGVKVMAYSATSGQITYTIDGSITNNSGIFNNLSLGNHQLKVTNAAGCSKDSSFVIAHGLSPAIGLTFTHPESCTIVNGTLDIQASSYYQPLTYSMNNQAPVFSNHFDNLDAGNYRITIRDQGNCSRDTSVTLRYLKRPDFLDVITASPTLCNSKSGEITITLNNGSTGVTAALNNGTPQTSLTFKGVDAGVHKVSLFQTGNCRYDTTITVTRLYNPPPAITIRSEAQVCFENNGRTRIDVSRTGGTFMIDFNNKGFSTAIIYDKLAPGIYPVTVRDNDLCSWDTVAEVLPYPKVSVYYATDLNYPNCKELLSGSAALHITGADAPYRFTWNNQSFVNGETVKLSAGEYRFMITDNKGCTVDSALFALPLLLDPACNTVVMPNAFTPNRDGRNDVLKPLHSPYLKDVHLTVFNRYGQIIFRSTPAQRGWDGTQGGKLADIGTYIWTVQYLDFQGAHRNMKGTVLLIR